MFDYNPSDHYWLRGNGMLYSSAQQGEVSKDNQQYKAWLTAGGQPTSYPKDEQGFESRAELAAVLAPYGLKVYPPTLEEKQATIVNAVQDHLDTFAQTRNYDSIFTAATYVASTNPQFALEGRYALEARDATWAKYHEILNAFLAGDIAEPTLQEIMAQLPILEWPVVTNE